MSDNSNGESSQGELIKVDADYKFNIINGLINGYDAEINKQRAYANKAYKGMLFTLALCLLAFLVPNFYGNSYEHTRKSSLPIQDSIYALSDTMGDYKFEMDMCQKRFNDIRIIQNKYGSGLDSLYFQIYADDGIFSNLLYRPCKGQYDTGTNGKYLAFGGEIPFTGYHDPLKNSVIFVKLNVRDTMQDKNFDLFRSGITSKLKSLTDSITVLNGRRETNIFNNRNTYDIIDAMSVRVGALVILIFMVNALIYMQRYYNRLAQYYISRRDALKLHLLNDEKLTFDNTVNLLSPSEIEMTLPKYF